MFETNRHKWSNLKSIEHYKFQTPLAISEQLMVMHFSIVGFKCRGIFSSHALIGLVNNQINSVHYCAILKIMLRPNLIDDISAGERHVVSLL